MRALNRVAVVVALLAAGCGSSGGSNNTPGSVGDAAAGDEAGSPGRRGGGGGPFGGGEDDAGGAAFDVASIDDLITIGDDAPVVPGEDAPVARDSARDRNRDVPAPSVDTAPPAPDAAPDLAPPVDTAPLTMCQMCQEVEKQYADAVAAAAACTIGVKGECMQKVSASLSCPCNNMWVNSTTEPEKVAKVWQDMGCAKCQRLCPLACRVPSMGVCYPSKLALPIAPGPGPGPDPVPPIIDRGTCGDMNSPPMP